ncbi:MAG: hypothetical protein NTW79_02520 [Candidatus Berkelbacteria bacterium]|nr:hypothetical protein [Candidatus Berkelbacteria bacterium]
MHSQLNLALTIFAILIVLPICIKDVARWLKIREIRIELKSASAVYLPFRGRIEKKPEILIVGCHPSIWRLLGEIGGQVLIVIGIDGTKVLECFQIDRRSNSIINRDDTVVADDNNSSAIMVPDIHGARIFLLTSQPPTKIDFIYLMIGKIKLPEIRIAAGEPTHIRPQNSQVKNLAAEIS